MKQRRVTVLVVEDEDLIRDLMAGALTDWGYDARPFAEASSALEFLRSGAPADVLFTDIDLGDGMDGVTLAQVARALRPELPVVYASGRAGSIDRNDVVANASLLPKPFTLKQVATMLSRLTPAQPGRGPGAASAAFASA